MPNMKFPLLPPLKYFHAAIRIYIYLDGYLGKSQTMSLFARHIFVEPDVHNVLNCIFKSSGVLFVFSRFNTYMLNHS